MNNANNNNDPVVLGTLKKDKSSKPGFVIIIFINQCLKGDFNETCYRNCVK